MTEAGTGSGSGETKEPFLKKMKRRLKRRIQEHAVASAYFKKMSILASVPSLFMTGFASVGGFLSTSSLIDSGVQQGFGIAVGCVAALSTVLQTFITGFQFAARVESHSVAAQKYTNLHTKCEFENEMPNEDSLQAFADQLEQDILAVQSSSNYFVPQWVKDKLIAE